MDPAIPSRTLPERRRVVASVSAALIALAGAAGAAAAITIPASAARVTATEAAKVSQVSALTANWYESAPYYSVLDSSGPDLGQVMAATGAKAFDLGFVLASSNTGCSAAWNATDPVSSDTQVSSVINEVRGDGGDVIVSAGGYNGTKLGQVCGSASATAAAYQQVITTYGLHAMDFDLEEPEIENSTAIANELGAAQILQQEDPGLFISITIPSTPTPTPTPTGGGGGGGGSCTAPAWSSSTTYTSGNVVSYNGSQWTANQWNYNEVPGGASGAWNNDGAC